MIICSGLCLSFVQPFYAEEVKASVWDCDIYKIPGPDGIKFGLLKEFWLDMKDDIMRFISEFLRNGKLTKGICNNPIFRYFILYYFYMYLYMLVCDYLSLGVFS